MQSFDVELRSPSAGSAAADAAESAAAEPAAAEAGCAAATIKVRALQACSTRAMT